MRNFGSFDRNATPDVAFPVRSVWRRLGILFLSLVLSACTVSNSSPMSSQPVAIENSAWRLEQWEFRGDPIALVPETEISLSISGEAIEGTGGCNRFGGSLQRSSDRISVGPLRSTERGCAEAVMSQETQFLTALQSAYRAAANEAGRLVVSYRSGSDEGTLYFAPLQ